MKYEDKDIRAVIAQCKRLSHCVSIDRIGRGRLEVVRIADVLEELTREMAAARDMRKRLEPSIICLIGSTKFKKEFIEQAQKWTLAGYIVLTVHIFEHADKVALKQGTRGDLLKLHKRKIRLADRILVVDVQGYIGDDTKAEIKYALELGKTITYLSGREGIKGSVLK